MTLTVRDLKNMIEDLDDDTEVRFASQPGWPFEYSISDVQLVTLSEPDDCENLEEDENAEEPEFEEVVYLVEGNQIGYLPGVVREAIGW